MTWPSPPPGQQLRREAGGTLGERQLHPLSWEDLRDKPDLSAMLDHPMLNRRKWVYSAIDAFGSSILGEWLSVTAGGGVGTLNSVGGAVEIKTSTGIGNYDTLCAGNIQTYLPWDLDRYPHFEVLIAFSQAVGTSAVRHIGFAEDHALAAPTDLACFRATGAGNIFAVTRTGGSETAQDTGLTSTSSLNVRRIFEVWADTLGTRVGFAIWNDNSPTRSLVFGPLYLTATIPTGSLAAGISVKNDGDAAARGIQIDYGEVYQLRQGQNP